MNQRGRDVLIQAALEGRPQWRSHSKHPSSAEYDSTCAMLLLMRLSPQSFLSLYGMMKDFGLSSDPQRCPVCDQGCRTEFALGVHLNDDHGFDFLTIANKMPNSEVP